MNHEIVSKKRRNVREFGCGEGFEPKNEELVEWRDRNHRCLLVKCEDCDIFGWVYVWMF